MRIALVGLCCLVALSAPADERILSFHSHIQIHTDGWIDVTETIKVRAEGQQIRRGIFRDYPVEYKDRLGNDVKVLYEPKSVLRDGSVESMRSEQNGASVRTYFGSADRLLQSGEYVYTYRYAAGRMLGYFDDVDELFWNVTGNDAMLPMDKASATVTFDFDVAQDQLAYSAYVGPFAESGEGEYVVSSGADGELHFETRAGLAAGEGLTIAVGWPKGNVAEPGEAQRMLWLLSDNRNLLVALAGLIAMLGYYVPVWIRYGKDPQPGVIVTLYEPPQGYSPASLRYIENMGYDNSVMTAAIVSLAVKGYVRIEVEDSKDERHTLHRAESGDDAEPMATGEKELYEALFGSGHYLELKDENHERIGAARKAHEQSLQSDYRNRHFRTNGFLNLPPLLIGVIAAGISLAMGPAVSVFVIIIAMLAVLVFFAIVMKQPTAPGRQVLDRATGFREYLEIAEKEEMNLRNPPEKTPALFERYLPFALALGVEQQWAERFAQILAGLQNPQNSEWHPSWYGGAWSNFDLAANTSGLSSGLGNALQASVSPPGTSSGSTGGGFSGGGGGGGGVGGW